MADSWYDNKPTNPSMWDDSSDGEFDEQSDTTASAAGNSDQERPRLILVREEDWSEADNGDPFTPEVRGAQPLHLLAADVCTESCGDTLPVHFEEQPLFLEPGNRHGQAYPTPPEELRPIDPKAVFTKISRRIGMPLHAMALIGCTKVGEVIVPVAMTCGVYWPQDMDQHRFTSEIKFHSRQGRVTYLQFQRNVCARCKKISKPMPSTNYFPRRWLCLPSCPLIKATVENYKETYKAIDKLDHMQHHGYSRRCFHTVALNQRQQQDAKDSPVSFPIGHGATFVRTQKPFKSPSEDAKERQPRHCQLCHPLAYG